MERKKKNNNNNKVHEVNKTLKQLGEDARLVAFISNAGVPYVKKKKKSSVQNCYRRAGVGKKRKKKTREWTLYFNVLLLKNGNLQNIVVYVYCMVVPKVETSRNLSDG